MIEHAMMIPLVDGMVRGFEMCRQMWALLIRENVLGIASCEHPP